MKIEQTKKLQNNLKKDLELLSNTSLSDAQVWESLQNLSGFFRVLNQMKKEANAAL